jgi:hypothetical protein
MRGASLSSLVLSLAFTLTPRPRSQCETAGPSDLASRLLRVRCPNWVNGRTAALSSASPAVPKKADIALAMQISKETQLLLVTDRWSLMTGHW